MTGCPNIRETGEIVGKRRRNTGCPNIRGIAENRGMYKLIRS